MTDGTTNPQTPAEIKQHQHIPEEENRNAGEGVPFELTDSDFTIASENLRSVSLGASHDWAVRLQQEKDHRERVIVDFAMGTSYSPN